MTNEIHPTAIIHRDAKIGSFNYFGPYCVVGPNVVIGNHNRFESHISIGTPAEHRDYFKTPPGPVRIGDNNIIREFVTINGGTSSVTMIEHDVVLLRGSHLGHDAIIRSNSNLSCNVLVGGHTVIGKGANLGLSCVIHQQRVIGAYSMIGMNSTVSKHVPPFLIAFGTPCEIHRVNRIGLKRAGIDDLDLQIFEDWFQNMRGVYEPVQKVQHEFEKFISQFETDLEALKRV